MGWESFGVVRFDLLVQCTQPLGMHAVNLIFGAQPLVTLGVI